MTIALSKFLGPIPLDVVVREVHESDLFITSNPVEFGANVSDHAIIEPKRLVMDAVAGSRPGTPGSVAGAFQAITRLQESRQPFSIVTALTVYRNMLIERLSVDRDKTFGRVLFFRAELREVIIVDTETTSGGLSQGKLQDGTAKDRGSPTTQRGNNVTKPAPTSTTTQTGDGIRRGSVNATGASNYEAPRNRSIALSVFGGPR
jgi:hypothetical protein